MMNGLWLLQTALTMGKPAALEGLSLFRAVLTVGAVLVLAWWPAVRKTVGENLWFWRQYLSD